MAALLRADHDAPDALLDQSDALAYADVHPAARVMLVGAVFESHVRELALALNAARRPASRSSGSTGIETWASALRGARIYDNEQKRLSDVVRDWRTKAAHGHFDGITHDVAAEVTDAARRLMRTPH